MSAPMLDLAGVNAGYGTFQALFGASLEVRAWARPWAVIGPNGAGKTTLMRVISKPHRARAAARSSMEGRRLILRTVPAHRGHRGTGHRPRAGKPPPVPAHDGGGQSASMGAFMPSAARPKFAQRLEFVYSACSRA